MSDISLEYNWGREPVKVGYYMVILKSKFSDKLKSAMAVVAKDHTGEIGCTSFTGHDEHTSMGNPQVAPMEEYFLLWARLPDPM